MGLGEDRVEGEGSRQIGARFGVATKRTDLSTAGTDESGLYLFPGARHGYYAYAESVGGLPALWEVEGPPGAP